jgi:hypothetical protein
MGRAAIGAEYGKATCAQLLVCWQACGPTDRAEGEAFMQMRHGHPRPRNNVKTEVTDALLDLVAHHP